MQIDSFTRYAEDGCSICLVKWEEKDDICLALTCGHVFHEYCLKPHVINRLDCPNCRKPIPSLTEKQFKILNEYSKMGCCKVIKKILRKICPALFVLSAGLYHEIGEADKQDAIYISLAALMATVGTIGYWGYKIKNEMDEMKEEYEKILPLVGKRVRFTPNKQE